jgi:hypothetical protein
MSLFDTIICDHPLPLPEFSEDELKDMSSAQEDGELNFNEIEWQTKDMGSMLDLYSIEDDGQIYFRSTDWREDEGVVKAEEGELEKFEKTAEINFYNMILGEEYDHWIEFKATVWKGELKELDLVEYKKEDNADRLEYQGRMEEQLEKQSERGKLYKVYRYLITKPIQAVRLIMGFIVGLTFKVERWLP